MPMQLRLDILGCNRCFEPQGRSCTHHEDLVGGYSPGRVLFVGVNPQTHDVPFYRSLPAADSATKMLLGDHLFRIFAGAQAPPTLASMRLDQHPGRAWAKRLAACLGISMRQLAEGVSAVDAYKHATPNQATLENDRAWPGIQAECPTWLERQIAAVRPPLVVISGHRGRQFARDRLSLPNARQLARRSMGNLHGRVVRASLGGMPFDVLFTYAVSGHTVQAWASHPRTNEVRARVRRAVDGGAVLDPVTAGANPPLLYLVESEHDVFEHDGAPSFGVGAKGCRPGIYLHRLALRDEVVELVNRSPFGGRGGRKYGPDRAWYVATSPRAHWAGTTPRASAALRDGRMQPMSADAVEQTRAGGRTS